MTSPPRRFEPPTRHGVGASCVSLPAAGPGATLIDFLAQRFANVPRDVWTQRMAQGLVLDADGQPVAPQQPYPGRTWLYYYRELPDEPRIPFEASVLFQDAHLVVADKPHFLPVIPAGRFVQETLLVRLKRQLGLDTLAPIHRIDRETAGLVLFCVRPQERGVYHALFRQHEVSKHYEAIAPWRADLRLPLVHRSRIEPGTPFFRQHEVPGEPNSETRIELLETRGMLARYRLMPVSGKTHQLRVHMNALGLPIVGDLFYPHVLNSRAQQADDDYSRPLQLLARAIAFVDPVTGEQRRFESARRLDLI